MQGDHDSLGWLRRDPLSQGMHTTRQRPASPASLKAAVLTELHGHLAAWSQTSCCSVRLLQQLRTRDLHLRPWIPVAWQVEANPSNAASQTFDSPASRLAGKRSNVQRASGAGTASGLLCGCSEAAGCRSHNAMTGLTFKYGVQLLGACGDGQLVPPLLQQHACGGEPGWHDLLSCRARGGHSHSEGNTWME